MTTLPLTWPLSAYFCAFRTCSSVNSLSTTSLILPCTAHIHGKFPEIPVVAALYILVRIPDLLECELFAHNQPNLPLHNTHLLAIMVCELRHVAMSCTNSQRGLKNLCRQNAFAGS